MLSTIFTFYIFIAMSLITKIHIYWLKGGLWPGINKQDLINKVIGKGDMPGFGAYVVVIFGFILMAVVPLLLYFQIDLKIGDLPKYSLAFFALIFFIRALALFLPNIEKGVAKEFLELNKKIYAPLCFSLGVAFSYLYFYYV